MIKNSLKQNKGFTLIETLVSLAILTTAVVAMIWVSGNGVSESLYSKNKIIANYLAQEGVEIVRNIRDGEIAGGAGWSGFLETVSDCSPSTGCTIDATPVVPVISIQECVSEPGKICNKNFYLTPAGYYTHQVVGNPTSFRRKIIVAPIGDSEATVTVTVTWEQSGKTKTIVIGNYLSAWQPE